MSVTSIPAGPGVTAAGAPICGRGVGVAVLSGVQPAMMRTIKAQSATRSRRGIEGTSHDGPAGTDISTRVQEAGNRDQTFRLMRQHLSRFLLPRFSTDRL